MYSRPGKDQRGDTLEDLEDEEDGEQLALVFNTSRQGKESRSASQGEERGDEEDWGFAFGALNGKCRANVSGVWVKTYIKFETMPMAPGIML